MSDLFSEFFHRASAHWMSGFLFMAIAGGVIALGFLVLKVASTKSPRN